MFDKFGGWFNNDPEWMNRYRDNKYEIMQQIGIGEGQLDELVNLLSEKGILR